MGEGLRFDKSHRSVVSLGEIWHSRHFPQIHPSNLQPQSGCESAIHVRHFGISQGCQLRMGGFLLVLCGLATSEPVETAGVGFLISPSARRSVVSFQQHSARMAGLKLRVPGGKLVCNVYAQAWMFLVRFLHTQDIDLMPPHMPLQLCNFGVISAMVDRYTCRAGTSSRKEGPDAQLSQAAFHLRTSQRCIR